VKAKNKQAGQPYNSASLGLKTKEVPTSQRFMGLRMADYPLYSNNKIVCCNFFISH
jgi:hypothetical protein